MNKQIKFKYIWIALNFLLLALPVFIPSNVVNVMGICTLIVYLLSTPLNQMVLWDFFISIFFDGSIGSMYLMLFVFSVLAYIQWFVIVPRLVRFVKNKFFVKDLKISLSANLEAINALPQAETRFDANDFQQNWYDERRKTPVERVFEDENE